MVGHLKDHPFSVEAFFKTSLVITFALPKEEVMPLLPPCLEPDLFLEKWAFVALAVVDTRKLRPKGFPEYLGNDFLLTGYRIFTRFTTLEGKRLRGLYILKSETNLKRMEFLGSLFTRYKYSTTDLSITTTQDQISVRSQSSGLFLDVSMDEDPKLPAGSPFQSWKEARRFAGPLPYTFTWLPEKREVLVIEGVRSEWTPSPVTIAAADSKVIAGFGFKDLRLASAFVVQDIPYFWRKGKRFPWIQRGA